MTLLFMQRNYEVISSPLTHMHAHINKYGGVCIEPIPCSCVTVGYLRVNRLESTNFQLMIRGVAGYETIHRRVFETMAPYSWDPNQLSFPLPALRNLCPSFFSKPTFITVPVKFHFPFCPRSVSQNIPKPFDIFLKNLFLLLFFFYEKKKIQRGHPTLHQNLFWLLLLL